MALSPHHWLTSEDDVLHVSKYVIYANVFCKRLPMNKLNMVCRYSLIGLREHMKKRVPLATIEKVQQLVRVSILKSQSEFWVSNKSWNYFHNPHLFLTSGFSLGFEPLNVIIDCCILIRLEGRKQLLLGFIMKVMRILS